MTTQELLSAFRSPTPAESAELATLMVGLLAAHVGPAYIEFLRTTLQTAPVVAVAIQPGGVGHAGVGPGGGIGTHGGSGGALG
jgi:hypothetical protein